MINGLIWLVKDPGEGIICQAGARVRKHPPVPQRACVKVFVRLSLEWRPSWSSCPGLVVSGGVFSACACGLFWIRRFLYSEPTAWNPAEIRPVWPPWRAPASQLRLYRVCVNASENVHVIFCLKLFFYFSAHQAYSGAPDLSSCATACTFSGPGLPCCCTNICVMVSGFIAWKRLRTSVCACERLCGLSGPWYIIFPVCVCVFLEYLAMV